MDENENLLEMAALAGADIEGWSDDGYGIDAILICPCGEYVEQDGDCPNGHVSPLVEAGLI